MVKLLLSAAMALTVLVVSGLSSNAKAQNNNGPAAVVGPPVTCEATGYWSGNSITLVIRKLDSVQRTVDVDFIGLNRIRVSGAEFNSMWTFDGDVLQYNRGKAVRIMVHVGQNDLKGKYENFDTPPMSKDPVVFSCNGPTTRVIVR